MSTLALSVEKAEAKGQNIIQEHENYVIIIFRFSVQEDMCAYPNLSKSGAAHLSTSVRSSGV